MASITFCGFRFLYLVNKKRNIYATLVCTLYLDKNSDAGIESFPEKISLRNEITVQFPCKYVMVKKLTGRPKIVFSKILIPSRFRARCPISLKGGKSQKRFLLLKYCKMSVFVLKLTPSSDVKDGQTDGAIF